MKHALDNPVYNALISGNKDLSTGNENAKYFAKDVAPFVGLIENSQRNFESLFEIAPFDRSFAFMSIDNTQIQPPWKATVKMGVFQLVFTKHMSSTVDRVDLVPLGSEHIPQMLSLTKLTQPGPFFVNTIAFGNYKGVFVGEQLVAMAGHRLHPFDYTEVSAVCTHPDHTGKGYARKLLLDQVFDLQANAKIPFLHVKTENTRAIKVYEDLGFIIRKEFPIYMIQKIKPE